MAKAPKTAKAIKKKKLVQKVIAVTLVVILILTALVIYFQQQVEQSVGSRDSSDVLSADVTVGSIQTTVSASGRLQSEDVESVDVSTLVELEDIYVSVGDTVEEGKMLASVIPGTVLSALSDVQTKLTSIDSDIRSAESEKASTYINSTVSGRVKVLFAQEGDDVATVMCENGAMAIISMDGKMSVTIDTTGYAVGESVSVVDSKGNTYTGTVANTTAINTVVTIPDDTAEYQDTVTVDDQYTGTLEINKPLKVSAYAGTVSAVRVKLNAKVYNGTNLYTLKDTGLTGTYNKLLKDRQEYEDIYNKLVKLYKDGGVLAPVSGKIVTVEDPEDSSTDAYAAVNSTSSTVLDEFTFVTIDPCKTMSVTVSVDESDILSLAVGQEVSISVSSLGEDTFKGTVTEIDTTATSSSGVTVYGATVTLDRVENMLAGMTAEISVTIEGVENAMLIPEDAVHKTSSTYYVYTTYDEENKTYGGMKEVSVGISNGNYIEITSGLSEGDTVYYTEKQQTFSFGGMSFGMGGMPSGMSSSSGSSNRPSSFSGGSMPSGSFSGGSMPSGMGRG